MVRVKICGITNLEDALCAVEHGTDALGFIFHPRSPRYVSPGQASEIIRALPPFVAPVGVFVNEARDRLEATVASAGLRVIQLHGDEPPEACLGHSVPVIRALRVGQRFDLASLKAYPVDTFLLDTQVKGAYGGTGETFDWEVARVVASRVRVVLAGGLSPDNVAEAIRVARPYAVDAISGVEAEPGRKDHEKLAAFLGAAKSVGG